MIGMIKVRPVILCGGSGSRLWPLSRSGFPKQFLCLTGKESLFQDATKRLMGLSGEGVDVCSPFIVTNEEHRFLALEQLREIGIKPGVALLEPVARNTAPALTLAALAAVETAKTRCWSSLPQTRPCPTHLLLIAPCMTLLNRQQRGVS